MTNPVQKASSLAVILAIAAVIGSSTSNGTAQSNPPRGDGIFTPVISPVAPIDKTGRPITIEATQPEPSFSDIMVAGKQTGDSYTVSFPTGSAGGACVYTGTGRYLIEANGTLTFQVLADCGKLKRGYSYMICRLNEKLLCSEAPWWFFKGRTFAATRQGVVIDGSMVHPWRDGSEAPQQLQVIVAKITAMNDRFRNDSHVVHSRLISCRNFRPATRSYEIHDIPTTCLIKSLCNGIPSTDSLRDGEVIDWNSPVGNYVKQKNQISDVSTWSCWIRTQ
jgi:hypothetical protein